VINLGPADVKKEGSAFDLPMAIGILGGYGLLAKQDISDYVMVGELSLEGKLRPVKGVLSIAMLPATGKFRICSCLSATVLSSSFLSAFFTRPEPRIACTCQRIPSGMSHSRFAQRS
jgi:predicted ATPase with chaperone activity